MKKIVKNLSVLCCSLCLILAGTNAATAASIPNSGNTAESTAYEEKTTLTAAQLYQQTVNSTVGINTSVRTNYYGFTTTAAVAGSGFIYSSDGYIITNYHVVEDGSNITVTTYDNTEYSATLIGYNEKHDIAVLKVDADDLTPVVVGDSDQLVPGEEVCAIGNPLGELTFSLTKGIVSALNREVTLSSGITMNLIQTDCAINSGNSGGALFNMYGELVGITNAKYSSSTSSASVDNIGFAIPFSQVQDLIDELIEKAPQYNTVETSSSDQMEISGSINVPSQSDKEESETTDNGNVWPGQNSDDSDSSDNGNVWPGQSSGSSDNGNVWPGQSSGSSGNGNTWPGQSSGNFGNGNTWPGQSSGNSGNGNTWPGWSSGNSGNGNTRPGWSSGSNGYGNIWPGLGW